MLLVYRHIIRYCSLLIIVFSMIGCAADNFSAEVEEEEVVPGDLVVSINVNLDGSGSSMSRAEDDEVRIPGTADENRLSHGHLFLQSLNDKGNPVEGQPMYYVKVSLNVGENTFKLKNIDFGRKRVYIAANLSDEQASYFATNANAEYEIPLAMKGNGYGMTQEYARKTDIAMFCTEGQILDFIDNKLYVFEEPFTLKRLVAKVHVTATTSNTNGIEYCTLAGPMAGIGWIRLENVKYLINGLNTKSYLMQKYNNNTPEDPNFSIENNIHVSDDNIDPIDYQDFYFNSINSVSEYESNFAQAEKYDASRIPMSNNSSVENVYTEGLYCPENTFALPTDEQTLKAFYDYKSDAWPMVTHVIVSAKFTPKKIVVERSLADWVQNPGNISISEAIRKEIKNKIKAADNLNDNFKSLCTIDCSSDDCSSEEVAKAVLLSSLKMAGYLKEDDNSQGLPDETYFWNDSKDLPMVFTYGAAKIFSSVSTNTEQFDQFATVPDGVGYYFIYLDNTNSTTGDGTASYDFTRKDPANSIVERNAYYLVNIKSISGPGDATMKGDNILVNTVKTGWKVGGNAVVDLE